MQKHFLKYTKSTVTYNKKQSKNKKGDSLIFQCISSNSIAALLTTMLQLKTTDDDFLRNAWSKSNDPKPGKVRYIQLQCSV